jgi:prepilin-type N-terminal cleavage/methylation domain-containing protein
MIVSKSNSIYKNQNGFTLTEVLISVGISAIVVAAVTTIFVMAMKTSKSVEDSVAVSQNMEMIKATLGEPIRCTENFIGMKFNEANAGGEVVQRVNDYKRDAKGTYAKDGSGNLVVTEATAKVDTKIGGRIPIRQMRIKARRNLGGGLAVADLEVSYGGNSGNSILSLAPAQMVRTLPLFMAIDAGKIQKCWAKNSMRNMSMDEVCLALTDTSGGYDEVKGECRTRTTKWFIGTRDVAVCPQTARLSETANPLRDCDADTGTYDNRALEQERVLPSGKILRVGRAPMVADVDHTIGGCRCHYAVDIGNTVSADFKCSVRCIIEEDTTVAKGP